MEFEVDELLEDELLGEDDDDELLEEDAIRLVEARNADDMLELVPPVELELALDCLALDVTLALTVVELELLLWSRPNEERLPRIRGLSMEA